MTQVVTFDTRMAQDILSTLKELKNAVVRLNDRLEETPPYGSKEWWEWSIKQGKEDIKAGRYTTITNKQELGTFFKSL